VSEDQQANASMPADTGGPVVAATPVRTAFSLCLPMLGVLLLAAALLAAAAGAVRWLLVDERGSNWLLKQLPMVQVQGFQGALLGDSWRAQKLRVQWAGGQQWVLIEDLKAEGLAWRWRPTEHAWLGLQVQNLQAAKLTLATGPAGPRPIVLPFRWRKRALRSFSWMSWNRGMWWK
jgi:translocation and assembly module TamB